VCRYNWHSAGSLGWPFPCKNIDIFFKRNIQKQFYRTALGNWHGRKLAKCWLQFKKYCVIYYNFRHTFVGSLRKTSQSWFLRVSVVVNNSGRTISVINWRSRTGTVDLSPRTCRNTRLGVSEFITQFSSRIVHCHSSGYPNFLTTHGLRDRSKKASTSNIGSIRSSVSIELRLVTDTDRHRTAAGTHSVARPVQNQGQIKSQSGWCCKVASRTLS